MEDKEFEQQMNLLKKSYERVPSKFNADDVLSKIEEEGKQQKEVKQFTKPVASKWQKVSVWAVSLASVFIIGLLSASFMNDGKEQGDEPVSEYDANDIKKLEEDYQQERKKRQEMLGMSDEHFNELGFVGMADQLFALNIHPDSLESRYSNRSLEDRYAQVIDYLKLPNEMIEEASQEGEMNEEESMAFIDDLNTKIDHLTFVYNLTIEEHSEIMNTAKMNGELDADYLYANRRDLPKPVESMLTNAPKQSIAIKVAPDKKGYIAEFDMHGTMFNLIGIVIKPAIDLFAIKDAAPFTNGGELVYTPQESAQILGQIEQTLLSMTTQNAMYSITKSYYEDIAYTLIFGSTNTQVVENRQIKEEFRNAWGYLRAMHGVSPIKYFIKPSFDSLSNEDWTVNKTYETLEFKNLQEVFRLAEIGELEALMPANDSGEKSMTISWPNSEMQQQAHAFLKNPTMDGGGGYNYDNLTPIETVVLYDYAQQVDVPEIMYNLIHPYEGMGLMKDLLASGEIPDLIPVGASSLGYNDRITIKQNGEYHGTVEVLKDEKVIMSIPVIRNEAGVWQVSLSITETSYEEPLEGSIGTTFISKVQNVYNKFNDTYDFETLANEEPFIVAGVYLEALMQNDMKTQYELLVKGDNYITPTFEEFSSDSNVQRMDWKEQFKSYEYTPNGVAGVYDEYDSVVYFDLKDKFITGEETRKGFQMRKTHDGWRVRIMPFQ
ncbi:hypothetical protein [Paenisporosarcina sp. TG20]|uniref:hypothetical protein n=1 Tax=Paenisporosarcina sp. TG20 TaxID=1211706 RepID=UPI000313DF6B|nr:hypothetical protein [Paenisporosarcina sp. TG20]